MAPQSRSQAVPKPGFRLALSLQCSSAPIIQSDICEVGREAGFFRTEEMNTVFEHGDSMHWNRTGDWRFRREGSQAVEVDMEYGSCLNWISREKGKVLGLPGWFRL